MDNMKYHLDINLRPKDEEPIFTTERKTLRKVFKPAKRGRMTKGFCCKCCADSYRIKNKLPKYTKVREQQVMATVSTGGRS